MVDDLKKQMRRFENLMNFEGKLDATSRESMVELINALKSKFKEDLQRSLRLHRLEFFHDLVENHSRKRDKREEESISKLRAKSRTTVMKKDENDKKPEEGKQQPRLKLKISDEIVKIKAIDIDDWKHLMTLSRIYYVMRHPRSAGLNWKRRINKKRDFEKFEDKDFIEWRVSQDFRMKGFEEWAQRKSDARRLTLEFPGILESDEDSEIDELFQMLDPSDQMDFKKGSDPKKKKPSPDRPFKFCDESIEDWAESNSDDSTRSDVEDITEQEMKNLMKDFDEIDIETSDSEKSVSFAEAEEEKDIMELLSVYPEFSKYKEPIFREMDEAKSFEDWLKLYKTAIAQEDSKAKEDAVKFEENLDVITEDEVEANDEDPLAAKEGDAIEKPVEKQAYEPDIDDTKERTMEDEEESYDKSILSKEEESGKTFFQELKNVFEPDVADTGEKTKEAEEEPYSEDASAENEEAEEKLVQTQTSEPDVEDAKKKSIEDEEGSYNEDILSKKEESEKTFFQELKSVFEPDVVDTIEKTKEEEEESYSEDVSAENKEAEEKRVQKQTSEPDVEVAKERTTEDEGSYDKDLLAGEEKGGESLFENRESLSKPDIDDTEKKTTKTEQEPYDEDLLTKEDENEEKLGEKKTSEPDIKDS